MLAVLVDSRAVSLTVGVCGLCVGSGGCGVVFCV